MHRNSRWKRLFLDAQIKRWYDNVARGSRHAADVYIQRLGRFCRDHGSTPLGFAGLDQQGLNDLVLDLVSEMEAKDYAGSSTEVQTLDCTFREL